MSVLFLADGGAGGGLAGAVADWSVKIMDVLGSPGAGLANALDSIIPVLPSEVILPLAGFAANKGTINLYAALVWVEIGSIVGSVVMYYIGAAFGRERVLGWAKKIPLVQVHEVERTEAWFLRHGTKTVFFGRMVPVFRSLISIPAGVNRMPLGRFVLYTALGSAIWNTAFVLAGYLLGANWAKVEEYGSFFSKAVIALIVLAVGYFVGSRLIRRRRSRTTGPDHPDGSPGDDPAHADPDHPAPYGPRPYEAGQDGSAPYRPAGPGPVAGAGPLQAPAGAGRPDPVGEPPVPRYDAPPTGRRYAGTVYGTPRRPADPPRP